MKALSLFSGIGGIDLACEWAGIETVAFCEREPFPQKVLRKHWPNVPIYDDVCTLTKERLEADGIDTGSIGIIHGGYPCQPYSVAGKQRGAEDDRALWPEVRRLLETVRPRWFVGENVDNHVNLGLDEVLADLGAIGYTFQPFVIPACAVGAPHRRNRVFIVAYTYGERKLQQKRGFQEQWGWIGDSGENVADTYGKRWEELYTSTCSNEVGQYSRSAIKTWGKGDIESRVDRMLNGISSRLDGHRWPSEMGRGQYDWEPRRIAPSPKHRNARITAMGNAVVPQQIYPILAAIKQIDDMMRVG